MDGDILEWMSQRPEDWWASSGSAIYTWGNGSWNQLGHASSESVPPAPAKDWKDVQQVRQAVLIIVIGYSVLQLESS